jgi:ceramide glucosyltransferase
LSFSRHPIGVIADSMTMPTILVGGFCAVATLLHFASIGVVIARHRRLERGTGSGQRAEGVSIVRPLCGIENFSQATLASTFDLDHPNYEILFCAAHGADPVLPLVRRLITDHPAVSARLLLGNDSISANPKLNNVVKGWQAARQEFHCIVFH